MRFSNTDSSIMLELESKAMVWGWRSVGSPGYGWVLTLKPRKSPPLLAGIAESWSTKSINYQNSCLLCVSVRVCVCVVGEGETQQMFLYLQIAMPGKYFAAST